MSLSIKKDGRVVLKKKDHYTRTLGYVDSNGQFTPSETEFAAAALTDPKILAALKERLSPLNRHTDIPWPPLYPLNTNRPAISIAVGPCGFIAPGLDWFTWDVNIDVQNYLSSSFIRAPAGTPVPSGWHLLVDGVNPSLRLTEAIMAEHPLILTAPLPMSHDEAIEASALSLHSIHAFISVSAQWNETPSTDGQISWQSRLGFGVNEEPVRGSYTTKDEAITAAERKRRQLVVERIIEIYRARGGTLAWGMLPQPLIKPIVMELTENYNSTDQALWALTQNPELNDTSQVVPRAKNTPSGIPLFLLNRSLTTR